MPWEVRKAGDGYQVVNLLTGDVKAKHTSKRKAERQVRLLRAEEHGYKPGLRRRDRG